MCNVKHEISLREHDQDFLPIYEITNNITIYIPSTILTENDKTAFSINQNIVQVQNVCLFNSSIFMEYMPDTSGNETFTDIPWYSPFPAWSLKNLKNFIKQSWIMDVSLLNLILK